MTQVEFDALLAWLDPDRDRAAQKYEEIRRRIIKILVCRGCPVAEDLADKTIDRVARKVAEIARTYVGDPILYFYGVAKKVHQEWIRKRDTLTSMPVQSVDPPDPDDDLQYECLEQCMNGLKPEERKLVLGYYEGEKQSKIDHRKELADSLGIGLNTLRIRVYRIRATLQKWVEECVRGFQGKK